ERAIVLSIFIPLIISSGGNSGSQATTLIIRAMALGEIKLRDWFRVMRRELITGLALGVILGIIGFVRVSLWPNAAHLDPAHFLLLALTSGASLVFVVLWGKLMGARLPLALRRGGLGHASFSAPSVAPLVVLV